jgi:hypothetical protein
MVGEVFAGLSAIKAAFDVSKTLADIHDVATRDRAVIELQKEILSAQAAQIDLVERVRELEKEVTGFETWDAEKQRYELKNVGYSAFAYMLKPEERGVSPPHFVCTNCYEHKHIAIIQYIRVQGVGPTWQCPGCENRIDPGVNSVKWIG